MKNLLVVVDYQNDFVTGSLGNLNAEKIYDNVVNEIKQSINNNDEIIFTLDTHKDDYFMTIEGQKLPVKHCIKNSDGHKLYKEVEKLSQQYIKIEKPTFGSVELFNLLKDKSFDKITIIGVVTNICVISNAVILKAMFPNTPIYVKRSCCASNNLKLESEAYDIMDNLHINVID